ncbi:myosin light chain 2, partial [Cystoisospora suis]
MGEGQTRRVSCLGCTDFCTIVLLDGNKRPMMNLHKVPSIATVQQIKKKVSERLKEVGRSLSAEAMILYVGESRDEANEMRNEECLSTYNTLGVSRFTVTIIRRTRLELQIVLIRPEQKCLCIVKQKPHREEFPVTVPMAYSVPQL